MFPQNQVQQKSFQATDEVMRLQMLLAKEEEQVKAAKERLKAAEEALQKEKLKLRQEELKLRQTELEMRTRLEARKKQAQEEARQKAARNPLALFYHNFSTSSSATRLTTPQRDAASQAAKQAQLKEAARLAEFERFKAECSATLSDSNHASEDYDSRMVRELLQNKTPEEQKKIKADARNEFLRTMGKSLLRHLVHSTVLWNNEPIMSNQPVLLPPQAEEKFKAEQAEWKRQQEQDAKDGVWSTSTLEAFRSSLHFCVNQRIRKEKTELWEDLADLERDYGGENGAKLDFLKNELNLTPTGSISECTFFTQLDIFAEFIEIAPEKLKNLKGELLVVPFCTPKMQMNYLIRLVEVYSNRKTLFDGKVLVSKGWDDMCKKLKSERRDIPLVDWNVVNKKLEDLEAAKRGSVIPAPVTSCRM